MDQAALKHLIDVAAGRLPADLVIRNCQIVDVGLGEIRKGDIAIVDGLIAGTGDYEGKETLDAQGLYAMPGLIDAHIHIESAFVTPEEISRLLVPFGTTTIIADPHEIANVAGLKGINYMLDAAAEAALHIEYVIPSCVPATPFENAGAILEAKDLEGPLADARILGLGEFMNFPGIIYADPGVLDKLAAAKKVNKLIDGHSPGITGKDLCAYASAGILADHECSTMEEMYERLQNGMYILMRQGSACHNLEDLLPVVTNRNARRCLLCSDDRQPKTILEEGHLDDHLRKCVKFGIHPVTAVQMATLNAAEAFGLKDRGALFPGRRADVTLVNSLEEFKAKYVFIDGKKVAENGRYLPEVKRADISPVRSSVHVKDFSIGRLKMKLKKNRVHVIDILPGGVVTGKGIAQVQTDDSGDFIYDPAQDIVKIAVIERHKNTGNVAVGLLRGYGIKHGAAALTIAHDSHNIITAGTNDQDMALAVEELIKQEGGIVLVKDGQVLSRLPLPVGGIMSDQSGEWVNDKLSELHETAVRELKVSEAVEPIMTLCFMALPVIPELKLTDMGLFDVTKFDFISLEADD
ncbi:MAG TPA: adenine deaminase [Bacillota bacterium]|jgi:adenine deaminase|nr:adenine deaminase [Fastidiosipila sp.]HPX93309.1 adenine deaminase [Bacillota bacterium]HQB80968.1 adenine deaminase [Bacillota bacterium]